MNEQLVLGIRWQDQANFQNFYSQGNEQLLHALTDDSQPLVYLHATNGAGKSHLLQALCQYAAEQQQRPAYLPMQDLISMPTGVLEGMESMSPLCIDDIQIIAGKPEWQEALFHLFNRVRDTGGKLVVSGTAAPSQLGISLPDLVTRLGWGTVYQLHSLDDAGKQRALQQRAEARGMALPDDVAAYILRRVTRDTHSLFNLLEILDKASLAEQRKLTIPFVKQYLD